MSTPLRITLKLVEHRKNKHAPIDFWTARYRGCKVRIIKTSIYYIAFTNLNDRVFKRENLGFILYAVKEHIDSIKDFRITNNQMKEAL